MSERLPPRIEIDESNRVLFYIREKANGFLSNFWREGFRINGFWYPTNEHYYQSQKAKVDDVCFWIREAPSAWLAMKAGRSLRKHEVRADWDTFKFRVMKDGLYAKFAQNDELKTCLLATGDAAIHEDSPTDMIWGIKGQDMLGFLLMEVREELNKTCQNYGTDIDDY